jgi:hypothetical protein
MLSYCLVSRSQLALFMFKARLFAMNRKISSSLQVTQHLKTFEWYVLCSRKSIVTFWIGKWVVCKVNIKECAWITPASLLLDVYSSKYIFLIRQNCLEVVLLPRNMIYQIDFIGSSSKKPLINVIFQERNQFWAYLDIFLSDSKYCLSKYPNILMKLFRHIFNT